jgi:hypothetical protein
MDADDETTPTDEAPTPADDASAASRSANQRSMKSLSGQEWETYRDVIKDLYNRMPLKDVITYMSEQYHFTATARMYKTRLSQWGLVKYTKNRDMISLVRKVQSSESSDVPMEFEIDGKTVSRAKVARFARRRANALDQRDRSTSVASPADSNAPSRTSSISADWHLLGLAGQDVEVHSDGAPSPSISDATQVASPMQLDQAPHAMRTLPTPFPQTAALSTLVESSEPSTIGPCQSDIDNPTAASQSPLQRVAPLVSEVPTAYLKDADIEMDYICPPTPAFHKRKLEKHMQTDTFQQALFVAMMLSVMIRHLPLGNLSDVRFELLEQHATFDTNVLSATLDLLRWLQLDREIVLLAAIYLMRFNASDTFPKSHNVWQQLLVALKFSQVYLHDEPYSADTWKRAIPHLANNSLGQEVLEMDVLSDEQIHLYVEQNDWKILETKFVHVSTSLLVWFDQGKFISQTAKQRLARSMELYR